MVQKEGENITPQNSDLKHIGNNGDSGSIDNNMYALTSPDNLLDNIQVLDKGGTSDDIDVERKTPQILSAFTISPKVANDKRAKAYLSPKSGLPNNVKKMIKKPLKNNSVDMDSPRYIKSNLPSLEGTLHGRN